MTSIVYQKFAQSAQLKSLLLSTGTRPLYESTYDRTWGIGHSYREAEQLHRAGRRFLHGGNLMGRILGHVRTLLREQIPYSQLIIIGDSIVHGTESDGVKVICAPGARARQLLLIAHCVSELPGVCQLLFHVGSNDVAPRSKDRPWLNVELKIGKEARAVGRLDSHGSSGEHLANEQLCSFRYLCKKLPSMQLFVSGVLPRFCDADTPG